jgi:flagellar hook-associated protein 2
VTSSIDGLVSGLSTSTMINSLMQVEAAPQTRLKSKVSTAEKVVASYQSVNSKVATMQTAADTLSQLSTWRSVKPAASSTSVTATATGGTDTTTGAVEFSVKSLAKAQAATIRVNTTTTPDGSTPPKQIPADIVDSSVNSITITVGSRVQQLADDGVSPAVDDNGDPVYTDTVVGKDVVIDISKDRSAKGIAAAINAATGTSGVKASLVKVSENESVLQFNGTKTGVANSFTIAGLGAAASTDTKGIVTTTRTSDAKITVGDPAAGGYSLKSNTNTFTGLMAGVSVTVSKLEDNVTLSSVSDVSSIAAKFQALVDAANATLTEIKGQTAYNAQTKVGSPLTGDFSVRQMTSAILGTISQGMAFRKEGAPAAPDPKTSTAQQIADDKAANVVSFGSLSKLGVALDSTGQLTFNAAKFTAAYNADPDAIREAGTAFADNFEALAKTQSTNVTSSITGRKNVIDSMNIQIDNWDARLAAKREALQKTYATLETSLSKLQSQSTWLSGQIASLG